MNYISLFIQSMINFMLDPKGDMPWNEDALAQDILHLNNPKVKFILLKYL
jgi:hypothetical protein